jgi:thiamine-phosphate pyrophosphorylase
VHLTTGAKQVRYARRELGDDAIVGAFSGASRHDGMSAAESGADYVSFGPVGPTGLGTGEEAPMDLFAWWSEMIEVPIVAEGGLDAVLIGKLAPITDFFAIGPEIWAKDDPMDALSHLWRQDK